MTSAVATSYTEKIERLEAIVRDVQTGADVDRLVQLVDEGRELLRLCTAQLEAAEARVGAPRATPKLSPEGEEE